MAGTPTLRAPGHLSTRAKRVWKHLVVEYELSDEPHLVALATEAAGCLDRAESARKVIEKTGPYMLDRFQQIREHPALKVERDSRILYARLVREMGLDGAEEPDGPRLPRVGGARK